ncbi:DENN domain-containing protein 4C [Phytophthora citrophthora]|uniref:DENN domain-containing protein 4C n=1 Tax=Phytophthora citrophthora TaxID=4793 RepID=A0AAD9GMN1_9STRA|nr:DENN domain-containing protein 4C [Phytophthora citrophthora]
MSQVHVILAPIEVDDTKGAPLREYSSWIPLDYNVEQLKYDVGRYWQLKPSKYELCDPLGNVLEDDKPFELVNFHPSVLQLRRREREAVEPTKTPPNSLDPFWIHNQLVDLFVFNALQNRQSTTLRLTGFQFKQLLQKATAKTVYQQQKKKLLFDKRVTLAFRGAQSNTITGEGIAGVNFDEFLDALVDVACFMYPKEKSKELSLEKLAVEHIIPYHAVEQCAPNFDTLSWSQIYELIGREKVKIFAHRFAKVLGELAASYSPNVGFAHRRAMLGYHEFHRFVRDVVPKTVPISSMEVCKVFTRYCQNETYDKVLQIADSQGPEYSPVKDESLSIIPTRLEAPMEIPCGKMVDVIGLIAFLAVPRLVKAKEKMGPDCSRVVLTSKLGVQSLKALLHHISNNLGAKGGVLMEKNVEFNRARVHFLLEFNKMHREDSLVDYQSTCTPLLKAHIMQHAQEEALPAIQSPSASTCTNQEHNPVKPDESEVDVEFSWNLDLTDNAEGPVCDSESSTGSPVQRLSMRQVDPQVLLERRKRELEILNAQSNEADEIYAFLAGELQRHYISKRPDDPDTVPHMLDVWVSAGEKYSDVINHVEASSQLRAQFLLRFGRSLYVFATQVLKSTTKVYRYEELFYITNTRVYSTSSDIWTDSSTFTLDLAMETLSLASGKLTQASDEFSTLVTAARATDHPNESDDDASSTGSDGEDSDTWTASALYERYLCCLFLRANCLAAYADLIAHNKKISPDYDLCGQFEKFKVIDERPQTSAVFFTSSIVLSKSSSPGEFYWEAKKMLRFLLLHSKGGLNYSRSRLHHNLAMVQFKLASHLPRGCDAEKQLLENALVNLDACDQAQDHVVEAVVLSEKRSYIRAVLAARRKFFIAETHTPIGLEGEFRDVQQDQEEVIAPFYRFILAATFGEFDSDRKGVILQPQLTQLSKMCGHNALSSGTLQWLLANFDHQDDGLTERGLLQYFCWLAEADPVVFCKIIDLLTAKNTGAQNISIYSGDFTYPRKHSSVKAPSTSRKTPASSSERHRVRTKRTGAADCIVVLSGKMTKAAGGTVSNSTSLSDIRLEPEVADMLPSNASIPEELPKFCFPDDIYLSTEPFSPITFDIVLTDIKGVRSYGSCLQFCEEKHPMDVLSLISATEKGRTVNLPSWVSLKDIQQGQTKWKCYAPKCLCVLSSFPLFQTFRTFLVYLYRISLANTTVSLESIIFNFFERTPLPTANSTQTVFKLADTTCLLSGFPAAFPLFSPAEVDFTILFQCLSPDNILKVYGYLLTEKKVVLSSSNRPILTHVAETLRALLHPFECQQVYIPLLPLSLVEFICAPVPFFMGIRSDQRLERLLAEGVILVDLDNNDIRLPPNEEFPIPTDVKARKLLHTLRKLSIWPASQRSRHSFGRSFGADERPISSSFEPSQPSDAEISQAINRHEELTEKWTEIQTLFSSFAIRILKEIKKHCSKVLPTPGKKSMDSVVFDEKGFLAMHPSIRDFCIHLFQTQLFQRSIENIWGISDNSNGTEPEQYWKSVRAKSMLRKTSEVVEEGNKAQRRRVIQAPLPPRRIVDPNSSDKVASDGFPTFNGKRYDDLLDELSDQGELESSVRDFPVQPIPPLSSQLSLSSLRLSSDTSTTSILTSPSFHDGDVDGFQLVNAARKRLEGRR